MALMVICLILWPKELDMSFENVFDSLVFVTLSAIALGSCVCWGMVAFAIIKG